MIYDYTCVECTELTLDKYVNNIHEEVLCPLCKAEKPMARLIGCARSRPTYNCVDRYTMSPYEPFKFFRL